MKFLQNTLKRSLAPPFLLGCLVVPIILISAYVKNRTSSRTYPEKGNFGNPTVDSGVNVVAQKIGLNYDSQEAPSARTITTDGNTYEELLKRYDVVKSSAIEELKRRQEMCRIVEEMVAGGHYEEAQNLVMKLGEGVLREGLIHSLFSRNSERLSALVTRVTESGFSEREQLCAWTGIMQNLSREDGPAKVVSLLESDHDLGIDEVDYLLQGAIHFINPSMLAASYWSDSSDLSSHPSKSESERRLAEIEKMFEGPVLKSPELRHSFYDLLVDELRGPMTDQSLSVLIEHYDSLDPETRAEIGGQVMNSMFAESPSKALEAIRAFGNNSDLPVMLSEGIKGWLRNDSLKVETWLAAEGPAFGQNSFDAMTKTVVSFLSEKNRLDDASAWASKISDPDLRRQAEGVVWTKDRDTLRNSVILDPVGTVDAIVSGQSKYADYLLEGAMTTWVEKDFDKANQWYQESWKTLPASKAQYIAAAFAKQAANQGDTATARQWASHIQDAKTKDRVNTVITKAESRPKP